MVFHVPSDWTFKLVPSSRVTTIARTTPHGPSMFFASTASTFRRVRFCPGIWYTFGVIQSLP